MASGAIFNIIANDGKADRMIMASDLLKMRIRNIMCEKSKAGVADPSPSLFDIEKTHILFVNAHYKPFAAIGYEYLKVGGNKSASFGQTTQFSIPQFGDFFSDMVLNITLAATSATVGVVPAFPGYIGAADQATSGTQSVSASNDSPIVNTYTRYTYQYVDAADRVLTVGAAASNYVRYCEYPGQRFCRKVRFDVNGNPLDEYGPEAYMYHQKFKVAPHKETGWKRLVGQETLQDCYSDLLAISGTSNFANADTLNQAGTAAAGAPVSSLVTARRFSKILAGPQTPKAQQPALDLWVPLIFWFNKDVKLAIPSVAIPYGQRYITIDIEAQNNLLFTAPGNLFLRLTTESFANSDGTIAGTTTTSYQSYVTRTPVLATGSTIDTTQQISNMDLYINNIFLNPEIHDIYIKRIGFSLIRVHRLHTARLSTAADSILLSQLKWPIEYFFAGLRPIINIDATNVNQYRDWHRFTAMNDNVIELASRSVTQVGYLANNSTATPATLVPAGSQETVERITFPDQIETIVDVQIKAHGIVIYDKYKTQFYRDYMAYTYGGINIITPEDKGVVMINFCLYPGHYQPSGHINISRAREFYFNYTSLYVSSTTQADLIVLASAINFLLISDGSAILRYST